MRIRRRRKDYTPEQEASRKALHRAEMWVNIVSHGIADAMKRETYCTDGTRSVIEFVNTELAAAVDALDAASKAHDANFPERRQVRLVIGNKNPTKLVKKARKKKEPAA